MQNNVVTSLDMCANDLEWLAKILRRTRFIRSILPPCAVILLTDVIINNFTYIIITYAYVCRHIFMCLLSGFHDVEVKIYVFTPETALLSHFCRFWGQMPQIGRK